MRIVNKKRFIISMSFLFVFVISIFSFIESKVFSYSNPEYHLITVSEGDTLWSIAQKGDGNVSEMVYQIKIANALNSSYIYPGQELYVPFEY